MLLRMEFECINFLDELSASLWSTVMLVSWTRVLHSNSSGVTTLFLLVVSVNAARADKAPMLGFWLTAYVNSKWTQH